VRDVVAAHLATVLRCAANVAVARRSTYCPLLYESVFIANTGDVYTCCGCKPGRLGNINRRSLTRIWNDGLRLRLYRFLSRNRSLPCFFDCNVLSISQKAAPAPAAAPRPRYPQTVWLLYGEICNVSCIMCPQDHRSPEMLENDVLKRHIDWSRVAEIEMQGGEILAMQGARELYLWLTGECGRKVNLITNGVLIDETWATHLVRGSDWIQVSVNAATKATHEMVNRKSSFEKVIRGIEKMVAAKARLGLATRIIYKFTVVPENVAEIAGAIALADRLGCDEIHFGYDRGVIQHLADRQELRERVAREIGALLAAGPRVSVESYRLEYLGLV